MCVPGPESLPRPSLPGALHAEGIPFLPATAAMFVWLDLRQALQPEERDDPKAESQLWDQLVKQGVLLTPGGSMSSLSSVHHTLP